MDSHSLIIEHNEKDKKKAKSAAIIFAIFLGFLVLYPFWSYPFPPPGQEGILVSFGDMESGGNTDQAASQQEEEENPANSEKEKPQSENLEKNKDKPKEPEKKITPAASKSITQDKSEVAVKAKDIKKTESETVKSPSEKSESQQQISDEARKKAEFEQAKKQFGELIGKGTGSNAKPGNSGDPSGDPNADNLSGISKGKGNIGGGLADRGVVFEPEIDENSQKSGKVVVRVCVNSRGEVIEAKYTQKGSTTTDTDLVEVAIAGSKRYKFSKTPIEKQCGTITIEFKLK